jgi:2,3-bisphosphoglycerate-dependent phosphoglycerate mutase
MSVEIIFETHCLSLDNEHDPPLATGWLGGRLSENGRKLAEELGERRSADRLDAVFTSDLARAIETTDVAFRSTRISACASAITAH